MLKMTCELYDDVKIVHDNLLFLQSQVELLEQECIIRDKDKPATELFIRINSMKREMEKMEAEMQHIVRRADLDQLGPLSKYVRPYLWP